MMIGVNMDHASVVSIGRIARGPGAGEKCLTGMLAISWHFQPLTIVNTVQVYNRELSQ
jgi:hypothetical protein